MPKCIESIMKQTYKNLEILLIDDGSNDGSEIICDEYTKKDNRIKVFHKKNGGLSSARNYGLKYATGEYLGFVDSDDYVEAGMYEHLAMYINRNVDIVSCGVRNESEKKYKRLYYADHCISGGKIMNNPEAMRELLLTRLLNFSVCNKLFKRELFNNVVFPDGKSSEDLPVIYEIFCNVKTVIHNGYADYHYIHRQGSITSGDFFAGRVDCCNFTKEIVDKVSISYPQFKEEALALYLRTIHAIMAQIIESNNKVMYKNTYEELKNILKGNEIQIRKNKFINENIKKSMIFQIECKTDKSFDVIYDEINNDTLHEVTEKLSEFYNILLQWVSIKEKGLSIADFIILNGYHTIAIYGMKELGELLYEELKNKNIEIKYVIDRNKEFIMIDVPVLTPDEKIPSVDAIIVTAVHYFSEIKELLNKKIKCPVYSLEDIVFLL